MKTCGNITRIALCVLGSCLIMISGCNCRSEIFQALDNATLPRPSNQALADWSNGIKVVYNKGIFTDDHWTVKSEDICDLTVEKAVVGVDGLYEITYHFKALKKGRGVWVEVLLRYYAEDEGKTLVRHDRNVLSSEKIK